MRNLFLLYLYYTKGDSLSFASIEYNYKSNKIHLWEYYGGERVKVEEDFINEYYVQCNAGEASHKDIYGTPMKKKVGGRKQDIDTLKQSGLKVAESDLPPEMKFLHQRYGNVKNLKPEYKEYNVCFIDIEIASGASKYKMDHTIKVRKVKK